MLKSTVKPTGEEELDDYIKDLVEITIKMMVWPHGHLTVWVSEYDSMYSESGPLSSGRRQRFQTLPG